MAYNDGIASGYGYSVPGYYPQHGTNGNVTQGTGEQTVNQGNQHSPVSAEDYDKHTAAAASYNQVNVHSAKRTVNVRDYVTPEQEARIADSMKAFEEKYGALTTAAIDELGVDENVAGAIALSALS